MWHPCNSCVLRVYICTRFKYYLSSLAATLRWFLPSFFTRLVCFIFWGKKLFFYIVVRTNCVYILKCFSCYICYICLIKCLVTKSCSESLILNRSATCQICYLPLLFYCFRRKHRYQSRSNYRVIEPNYNRNSCICLRCSHPKINLVFSKQETKV
jgi:hypothetical protein